MRDTQTIVAKRRTGLLALLFGSSRQITVPTDESEERLASSRSTFLKRFLDNKIAVTALVILLALVIAAVLAPLIAPYDPDEPVGEFTAAPSLTHPLGTDSIGRDMLSRLLYGMRVSILVGVAAALVSTVIGLAVGLVAGFFGRIIDSLLMATADMVLSFPFIMLVLVAAAIVGPGLTNIILIMGFVNWPATARLVRSLVLSIRKRDYVTADVVTGMPTGYMLLRSILPNAIAPVLINSTLIMAGSMLDEATLSFLGMGIQPPQASLGNMLNGTQTITVLSSQPWLWLTPGVAIVVLVMCISYIGDALRDAYDPQNGAGISA